MVLCPRLSGSVTSIRQRRYGLFCVLAVCSVLVVGVQYLATNEEESVESERKYYGAKEQTRKALSFFNLHDSVHKDISAKAVEFVSSTDNPVSLQATEGEPVTSYQPLTDNEIGRFKEQRQRVLAKSRLAKIARQRKLAPLYYPSTAPSRSPPLTAATNANSKPNYYLANLDQSQVPVYVPASNPQYRAFEVQPVESEETSPSGPPFVPAHRLVHFDLKGAPPLVSYLRKIIPLVAKLGATGILLEWEEMFPFEGPLASIAASNHYTRAEVQEIIGLAKKHALEIIPLVQTFGHLEFALKVEKWSSLRENPQVPQAICPSRNESFELVETIIDQVMALHSDIRYLHIGCDEVFHMGECSVCSRIPRDELFLGHVTRVARYVRDTYNVTPIIWDDMMRHMSVKDLVESKLGELVEPMVWVYAENVYYFASPNTWQRYEQVFPAAWGASAFKGAFGETLIVPDVKRHLENNLKWLEVGGNEAPKFKEGFRGLAITGWQRYDHFATLAELLPAGIPSLAVMLLATSRGYFGADLMTNFSEALGCLPSSRSSGALNLNGDKFLFDRAAYCNFPGSSYFKLTAQLVRLERDVSVFMKSVKQDKGWLTDYNVRHNFSSPARLDEVTRDLPHLMSTATSLARVATQALTDIYDEFTISEWLEQKILPLLKDLKEVDENVTSLKQRSVWPVRPLPMFTAWAKYGLRDFAARETTIQEAKVGQ